MCCFSGVWEVGDISLVGSGKWEEISTFILHAVCYRVYYILYMYVYQLSLVTATAMCTRVPRTTTAVVPHMYFKFSKI